jgi:hypothetical protein
MMRFPIELICNERNDKLCSQNAHDVFTTIPRIECGLKQAEAAAVVYPPRTIQYDDSKQTVIQTFQDVSPPFRMWMVFLLHNEWIARYRDIMLVRSFKYCTIATTKYDLQNKVATTKYDLQNKVATTKTSIFLDLAKGVKNSEN